jgi:hypothetical protein
MSAIADMVASLKFNDRRKSRVAFDKDKKDYKKGDPIISKEFTPEEKEQFLKELQVKLELENKQRVYKLIISLGLTVVVITGIVFAIKLTFF